MSEKTKNVRYALMGLLLFFCAAAMQAQTVSGNVKDATGEPIIGATVMEKGTQNGTVTDFDGNFTITLKGNGNKLDISYVGMQTQTIDVAGKSSVNVSLKDDAQMLEEVVAIGYGTVRKKDLTGAVSQVNAKQIENIPVANVSEAMTGKMAGVNITTTEGSPDADVMIRVRGGGSLSQDNSPLYIVDGFPVESISDISPSEIETIDVLKDASSTAIYGAQGANGVVIVTTKSGKEGNVKVDLNASTGWKKITKTIGVLDAYNYAKYQYELGSGGNNPNKYLGDSTYGAFEDLDLWKGVLGTDYQKEMYRTGTQSQYNLNVSGGNKDLKFNVGYAHNEEKSIMVGSGFRKDNINAKINSKLNQWLKFDFQARFSRQKIDGLAGGKDTNDSNASMSNINKAINWRPIEGLSSIDATDTDEEAANNQANPMEKVNGTYKQVTRFQQSYNAALTWKPWKGWTFKSELGYGWKYYDTDQAWDSKASQNSRLGGGGAPQGQFRHDTYKNWRNANTVTYDNKKLFGGRDAITVMIGEETTSNRHDYRLSTSINFPETFTLGDVLHYTGAGTALQNTYKMYADENMLSFFGRVNYAMMDGKYTLQASFREDGSSKFKKGNRWGFFPSIALAWRMSDEDWLKDVEWLSNLKLRLSFGTAGNNRISSGLFETTYALSDAAARNPYFGEVSTSMLPIATDDNGKVNLYNGDLKWETTTTRNFGIDYGFLRGRISGSIDLYWNTTKDLLMRSLIAGSTGYAYQYKNFGQTSNKGVEFTLNAAIVEKKDFTLNGSFNISYNKNKIDKLPEEGKGFQVYNFGGQSLAQQDVWLLKEGGALGEVYGYQTNGFFTAYDANNPQVGTLQYDGSDWMLVTGITYNEAGTAVLTTESTKALPGSLKFVGAKGEAKTVSELTTADRVRLGNTIPKWTGGFGFDAQWRTKIGTFDASVFCNFSLGNKILNATKMQNSYFWGSKKNYNIVADMQNHYTAVDPETGLNLVNPSDVTKSMYSNAEIMQRLNEINAGASTYNPANHTSMVVTDQFLENASFLRLQTLTIGYTLPKAWTKKFYCNNLRVYFTGQNLLCFTSYKGYDPEVNTSSKTNAMCPGVDFAAYPKSRSYVMGINLSF